MSRLSDKERKYNKVKTTEILDFLSKKVDYSNTKECNIRSDYRDELEQREPFTELKHKIDQLDKRLNDALKTIKLLLNHKHNKEDGKVNVGIEETTPHRFY